MCYFVFRIYELIENNTDNLYEPFWYFRPSFWLIFSLWLPVKEELAAVVNIDRLTMKSYDPSLQWIST